MKGLHNSLLALATLRTHALDVASQAVTADISSYAEALLQGTVTPGMTLGFVRVGENGSVSTEVANWGNMTEDGAPVTSETTFNIGSCSKAFTAAAMGILIDDFATGKNVTALPAGVKGFTWQTKVKDLLASEGWSLEDEWATQKLSLLDAFTHVSGIPRHDVSFSVEDTVATMYMLMQFVLEKYSGKSLHEFAKERIFTPLNMTSATYSGRDAIDSGLMSQAFNAGRRIPYWMVDQLPANLVSSAGGLIASASDMTKWLAMHANGGVNPENGQVVIPASIFKRLTTMYSIENGDPTNPEDSVAGQSPGWVRMSIQGHDVIYHEGGIPGFYSEAWFFPSDRIGIFTSANAASAAPYLLALRVAETYLGLDITPAPSSSSSSTGTAIDAPNNVSTSVLAALPSYPGTYSNPGYGNFTLCAATSSAVPGCGAILAAYAPVSANGTLDADLLYGDFAPERVWASQFRMRPTGAGAFVVQMESAFPQGYGRDETPFTLAPYTHPVAVQCEEKHGKVVGCGLMNVALAGSGDTTWEAREGSVEEMADAWFVKV
ncbi:beta-lactamase/transpeptidase-like protein [Epithele typhae]|uniref:beta-lactamase/transpeptidase-like protein n=1 Tax=Epithele typhae TaxID=378194 RepID=UPI0020084B07|nr:beta-lactamase/transpeptidase-like protein [Epithele typhae]KAH9925640.1 beta-lactamase/transpeptidase-like protein [Epithele typhae]